MDTKLEKIADPLKFYNKPGEVENDPLLSVDEKIKLLTNWLNDITLRQTADNENMLAPHATRFYTEEVEKLLRQYHQNSIFFTNHDPQK